MPFIHKGTINKTRLLISGLPNSGKTTSLPTFIYGPYAYTDVDSLASLDEREKACRYADNKHMVIITCPGEFGVKSLPVDTPHITSLYYEASESDDVNSPEWSAHAIAEFDTICTSVIKDKPDILVYDGLHSLWMHLMNRSTNGDYLSGVDLNLNPSTGRTDPYRSAKFYNQTHNNFGQYLAGLYTSSVPFIIATTWEEWESGKTEGEKPGDIASVRYLWPAIPGAMAKNIVGKFDARVSARVEKRCCHQGCVDSKESNDHYVWQFLPKNDVMGVGIKGIKRFNASMKQYPYVHQNWDALQKLIQVCT